MQTIIYQFYKQELVLFHQQEFRIFKLDRPEIPETRKFKEFMFYQSGQ